MGSVRKDYPLKRKERTLHEVDENDCIRIDEHETPEKNLLVGILMQALEDVRNKDEKARIWIMSNETSYWSFIWICETLNVNPKIIRDAVNISWPNKKKIGFWRILTHRN